MTPLAQLQMKVYFQESKRLLKCFLDHAPIRWPMLVLRSEILWGSSQHTPFFIQLSTKKSYLTNEKISQATEYAHLLESACLEDCGPIILWLQSTSEDILHSVEK